MCTHIHVSLPVCILILMFTKARGDALLCCRLPCSLERGSCQTRNSMFQLSWQPVRAPAILLSFPPPSDVSTGIHSHMVVCVCVCWGSELRSFCLHSSHCCPLKAISPALKRFLCLGKVWKLSVVSQNCMRRKKFS